MKIKYLAVVPARKNSKRIKNKNIKNLSGKKLIDWTLDEILNIKKIEKIIVSSDDKKIINHVNKFKILAPYIRDSRLAEDSIGIEHVLKEAVIFLQKMDIYPENVILFLPTNPFRKKGKIEEIIKKYEEGNYSSLFTVVEQDANSTPYWTVIIKDGKSMLWGNKELRDIHTRSQDFNTKCYKRDDYLYITKVDFILNEKPSLYSENPYLYIHDEYSVDINTVKEWRLAVKLLS